MKNQFLLSVDHPVLRDHQVYGRHVLPGLAYLDLFHQTFRDWGYPFAELELRNFLIYQPLIVTRENELLLTIEAVGKDNDHWHVEVTGAIRASDGKEAASQRYSSVEVLRTRAVVFEDRLSAVAISDAQDRIPLSEIYAKCRARDLVHLDFMRAQGFRYSTEDSIVVECEVSEEALKASTGLMFHPTLTDCVAVSSGGVFNHSDEEEALWLPLFFKSFRASGLIQSRCTTRIRVDSSKGGKDVSSATFEFFDESGLKIAELIDFTGKKVRGFSLDAPAQSGLAVKAKRNADIDSTRRESPTDAVRSHAFSEVESLLRGLIAEQCDLSSDEVDPTQSFYEMGLKSVVLLNVVTALERRLGRTLSPILLFEYTTIHELAAYLCSDAGPQKVDAENAVEHSVATTKVTSDTGEIAIIGFAGRFPGARTPEELWQVLRSGQDCVRFVPRERWDHSRYYDASKEEFGKTYCRWGGFIDGVDEFDPLFFNIPPLEAELMDPQARLFLQTAWELTESVGLTRKTLKSQYAGKVGVYVGAMYQHYNTVALQAPAGAMTAISSFNAIANHASYFLGLHGPSIAMDTGCSSALTAIHFACRDLNGGDCLLAIAGAVNLTVHPNKYLALSRLQLLSSDPGVRSFGQSDGYLPAECVGALLLKPLNRAKADGDRVLAVIKATAINHGGHSSGYTTPNLQAQADLFESVLSKAKVDPRTISYVEAAANGSLLGDAIEVNALDRTFVKHSVAPRSCAIGTIKSNLGHAEAASGISQIAKLLLQMRHGMIVPSIKTEPGNVSLNWEETSFALQSTLSKWERPVVDLGEGAREYPRRAMVNSFGAGGAYASAVIEEYLPQIAGNDAPSASGTHVCVFSARRPPQLTLVVKQMLQFLEAHPEVPLNDVAYTLQVGREEMEYRYAVAVQNHVQLAEALRRFLADESEETGAVSIASGARRAKCVRAVRSNKENAADACNSLEELSPQYVAKQWVQGYEFDWARHHCASAGTIIGLPTYPFSRDRYWIIPALASSVSAVTAEVSLPVAEQHMLDASMTMVEQSVCNFLMQFLGVRGIDLDLDHGLQSYGVDSLIGLRLARYLEKTFGVRLTRRSMYEHQTLRALSRYVTEKLARNEAPCVRDQGVEAVGQPIALDAQVEHTTAVLRDHDAGFAATQHKFRTTIRMESDNSDGRGIDNESR